MNNQFSVQYKTKIVDVSKVVLPGELRWVRDSDMEDWRLALVDGQHTRYLYEWLDKFESKRVAITIELLEADDESRLLEGSNEQST